MTKRIVISKQGYDAETETDVDNLIFSSDYNTLKYYVSGSASIHITSGGGIYAENITVTHDLGYKPFFVVYAIDDDSMSVVQPTGVFVQPTGLSYRLFMSSVTTTKLVLSVYGNSSGSEDYHVNFSYKIYRNNLNI